MAEKEIAGQKCLIPREAGDRLGLSAFAVRNMIERGELPAVKIGGKNYVLVAAVERKRQQIEREMSAALAQLDGGGSDDS